VDAGAVRAGIKAQTIDSEILMNPITMMRNALGKPEVSSLSLSLPRT
jgi:hypothetical protein